MMRLQLLIWTAISLAASALGGAQAGTEGVAGVGVVAVAGAAAGVDLRGVQEAGVTAGVEEAGLVLSARAEVEATGLAKLAELQQEASGALVQAVCVHATRCSEQVVFSWSSVK